MSVFEIDEQGGLALNEQVSRNPLDLSKVTPGMFSGFFSAVGGGIMQGGSRTFTTVALAGAPVVGARDNYLDSFRTPESAALAQSLGIKADLRKPEVSGQEWYFRNVVEDVGQAATDYWAPDPAQTGTAGRIAGGLAQIAIPLAAAGGNPALLAGNEGIEAPAGLVKQGVDAGAAIQFGAVSAGATMLGFKIPASFGTTLLQRIGTGAAANLAVGTATAAAQQAVLESAGNAEIAKAYSPLNLEARVVDVLTGAAFGGIAHLQAGPKPTSADRDAVLTVANAKHMQVDTAPGLPRDEASSGAHQTALASAMASILRGEQVSVADVIQTAEFLPMRRVGVPTDLAANYEFGPARYEAYRRALESGFRADATNSSSSATGIDQFTAGTWRRIVAQAKPDWANGLNDNQLLAARKDPAKSGEMARALDAQNTAALETAGLDASAHNLYAAHHFGEDRGIAFARASGDTPMSRILSKAQLDANPYLKGKTKGDAIANWDQRASRMGIDAPPVVRMLASAVPEATPSAASLLPTTPAEAAQVVEQRLSTLDELSQQGRLSQEEVAAYRQEDAALVETIRRQEQLTRDNIVPADPRERISREEFDALSARRVEIRQALERSDAAKGYESVAKQLRSRLDRVDADSDLIAFADRISGKDQVAATPARPVLPDSGATPAMEVPSRAAARRASTQSGPDWMSPGALDSRPSPARGEPTRNQSAAATDAGAAEQSAAPRAPIGAEPDSSGIAQQAAVEAVAINPDLQVTLDDGTVVTAAEALARADADLAQAEIDSRGFAAAVTCALRFA